MSCDWWRAGHVTPCSPLIGPRTWQKRTKQRMEAAQRARRGKDRVADVEDGLGDPPKYPSLGGGQLSPPAQPGHYYANLSTAANTPANGKPPALP